MKSKAGKAKPKSAGRSKVAARVVKARAAAPARVKPKNPLLARWGAAFGLPPFKKIEPQHFKAAFAAALKENKAEIAAIAGETAKPTFNNTVVALEKSGRLIDKVASVFYNLAGAHTNEALQAIEREMAPKLAAHETAVMLNARIFKRVEDLYERRDDLDLTDEQRRVLELRYKWLVRAGAKLGPKQKVRVAEINQRLATLATQFSQNVLKDEQSWRLVLEERDLDGLPEALREAAARVAADRG
ncbi:MAG: peptidase M3, partial [Hyphomicrobium sp.]|nr:peptidase M3 [Hyphomicrobium sp.]